jgi:antitoxin component YwqK of YwqJK toxin-antitoxin module
MELNFTFLSPSYLLFKGGKTGFTDHNDSKRQIIVEPSDRNNYNMMVFRDQKKLLKENEPLFSVSNMVIMERSPTRIILQDWDENDYGEPVTHNELTINFKKDQVYNCILNLHDDETIYVFLNDSEISSQIYIWNYNSYNPHKNGVFKERLMNGFYNEWTFVNNQKHGEWRAFTQHGRVIESGCYHLGEPEGEYIEYFGNGKVKCKWIYKNGRRNGLAKYFNKEGFITLEGTYFNDKQVGKWIAYDDKGEFDRFEDYGEKGKSLFFKNISGAGIFVCRECGFEKKITGHLHGFSR